MPISQNQVTVTASATLLIAQNPNRTSLLIENLAGATFYVGAANVTAATGFPLTTGQIERLSTISAIYAITASGSATAAIEEEAL